MTQLRSVLALAACAAAPLLTACGGNDAPRPADSAAATPRAAGAAPRDSAPPATAGAPGAPAALVATVVRSYPHDPAAFTEGLFFHDGKLYESTGLDSASRPPGQSDVREVELATGRVVRRTPLDPTYFGEGITVLGGTLYQLTWKHGKAFTYDPTTLQLRPATHRYTGEGWGMTTDGESLIMSDGTARLRFLDPKTFAVRRTLDVHDGASPVSQLNELEWVKGEILANVWQSTQIVRIDPKTGGVTGWVDAGAVPAAGDKTGREDVLNGIAYDAAGDKLYVTGKYYTRLYEVKLAPR